MSNKYWHTHPSERFNHPGDECICCGGILELKIEDASKFTSDDYRSQAGSSYLQCSDCNFRTSTRAQQAWGNKNNDDYFKRVTDE